MCSHDADVDEVFNRCTITNATKNGQICPDSAGYRIIFNHEFVEDFQDPAFGLQGQLHTDAYLLA